MKPEDICPDFEEWPERWQETRKDLDYAQKLQDAMRPFIRYLIDQGLTDKTIQKHMDNLWLLGGEIVRKVGIFDEYDVPPHKKLRDSVGPDGGPVVTAEPIAANWRESFDTTCRKLYRFLEEGE